MSSKVFSIDDVSVVRDGFTILEDINWTVESGQHWAVLGANGSGKTSLLKVLMGYLTPTTGGVTMRNRGEAALQGDRDWDEWRYRVGFVSSSISEMVDPNEQAIEVVMAGRHGMVNYWTHEDPAKDVAAADRILKRLGAMDIRDKYWLNLSQGERQRILIGRAMMAPKMDMLILDEPCAGLDPVARESFLSFIEELTLKKTFKSLVIVTHHVEEIIPSVTHSLLLKEGKMVSSGPKRMALNSRHVSTTFGSDLRLRSRLGRYRLYFDDEEELAPGRII
ncbi:MAG: ATP-binding cassette domain-containing protein [Verrucomicrobiota bacterium]